MSESSDDPETRLKRAGLWEEMERAEARGDVDEIVRILERIGLVGPADVAVDPPLLKGSPYAGMTLNERLFEAGLVDEFDRALQQENVEGLRAILIKVGMSDIADLTIDTALKNKALYRENYER